jgi:hypothetical protein
MIGLPPPPASVMWVRLEIEANGSRASFAHWFYASTLPIATFEEFDSVAGQLRAIMALLAVDLMGDAGEIRGSTALSFGDRPMSARAPGAGLVGNRGGSMALNASTGIYWGTNLRGKSGRSITHVPAFPDDFTDDYVHLNATGVDAVQSGAASYLTNLQAVAEGSILEVKLVTLHRSSGGYPLPTSEIRFVDHGQAAPRIAGIQRRLHQGR